MTARDFTVKHLALFTPYQTLQVKKPGTLHKTAGAVGCVKGRVDGIISD